MRTDILAARRHRAAARLAAAAELLADRFGLDADKHAIQRATSKDRDVAELLKTEAIASFLEALEGRTGPGETLPDQSERLGAMTVPEAASLIAEADLEHLDALEAAELVGKGRKGVLQALEQRRAELDADTAPAGAEDDTHATD